MNNGKVADNTLSLRHGLVERIIIYTCAAGLILYALATFCLVPRDSGIDELGLFNPVYMKVHYGRMTYPIYGHFHAMFVHPPLRYSEIAAFMRLGLPLPYAEGLMITLLTVAIALVIVSARFDYISKLGLLFGFFSALIWMTRFYGETLSLRPDTQLAMAWFLGLILLQDGKLRNWDLPRLFAGSFVVTYASGIHYFGVAAFLAIGIYLLTARRQLPRPRFLRVVAATVSAACLFGIPYLLLFVYPNFLDIIDFARAVQSPGAWFSPMVNHFAQYATWQTTYKTMGGRLPVYALLSTVLSWKIPLFLLGSFILWLKQDTRELSLANLPLTLFVFAYSQGKSTGYFFPELIVYFSGLGILLCWLLTALFRAIAPKSFRPIAAGVFGIGFLWSTQFGYAQYAPWFPVRRLISSMDVARACAQEIVGSKALIAGRIGLWYVSGAEKWYEVEPDLLWIKDISGINLHDYFSRFDYVVEHDHLSNTTINSSLQSLPSWYQSGLFKLQGFFATDVHPDLNFLLFKTSASSQVKGFLFRGGKLYRFNQNEAGPFVFISRVCQFDSWPAKNKFNLPNVDAIFLPKRNAEDPSRSILPEPRAGDPQSAIVTSLLSREEFASRRLALDQECSVLDTIPGSLAEIDIDPLLARWRTSDRPMEFYRSMDDIAARPFLANTVDLPDFNASHLHSLFRRVSITGDRIKTISTAWPTYSFAADIQLPANLPLHGWVVIRQKVTSGQIGFGILDDLIRDFVARRFIDREDGFETIALPIPETAGPKRLIIQNGQHGFLPSEVQIEALRIISQQPAVTGSR